jgi:small subunit ribosomal protein S1
MNEEKPDGLPEDDEGFAKLLEESLRKPDRLEPGQMVEAAIVKITSDTIFLDVGRKGEGLLERRELADEAGNLSAREGDVIKAYYLPSSGLEMRFTTRIGSGSAGHAQLENAFKAGIPVQGTVSKEVKGGYEVQVGAGVRAFCPFSLMGLRRDEDKAAQIGKSMTFQIAECAERNVVLSRKSILEAEAQARLLALKGALREGMRVEATVTSVQKFGAFADFGGVEGLIPASEIAWTRTEDPAERLCAGQVVEVVIQKLDWEAQKHSLSMKAAQPDPWEKAPELWPVGSYQVGKVSRLAPFGAFVTLGEGVDGLLHVSKLASGRRVGHPREVLGVGQSVEVRVDLVDKAARKISLSLGDVVRAEEEAAAELKAFREQACAPPANLQTLGDILKARLDKKQDPPPG